MAETNLVALVGYCGLACGVCKHACPCKASPEHGDRDCYQRKCCTEKGIESFPCNDGYFAGDEWRGLCVACVECIKEEGIDRFASLAESNLDPDYGLYRFKSGSEIRATLRGARPASGHGP